MQAPPEGLARDLTARHLRAALLPFMNRPEPPTPAFVTVPAREKSALRLFVFPHSGSGAYPYRTIAAALPPWVELSILQLPGRETMFGSPMFTQMEPLIAAIAPALVSKVDMPYAFFGHSLGGHVAFEAARELRRRNAPSPKTLIASGTRAPHLPSRRTPLHNLSTPDLIHELRRYGGTPEAVLQNQELMDIFLPPLRADLRVFETYRFTPSEPFDFAVTAFGGRTDHRADPDEIDAWREHTNGKFNIRFFEGGHFYLLEQSKATFLTALRQALESVA